MEEPVGRDSQWYYDIFAQAQVGIYRNRMSTGRVLDANLRMAQIAGYETVEDLRAGWIGPECWVDAEHRKAAVAHLRAHGHVECFETEFYGKNRKTFWARVWARLLDDGDTLIGVVTDITAEKNALGELHFQKSLNESILDNVPAGIALLDRDFRFRKVNRTYRQLLRHYLGIDGVVEGRTFFDLMPGTQDQVMPLAQEVLSTGQPRHMPQFRLTVVIDSRTVETWWDCSLAPTIDASGKIEGLQILCRDITQECLAQKSQQQTDQWLRLILQHSSDGINVTQFDPKTFSRKLILANDSYVRISGFTRKELMASEDLNQLVTVLYNYPDESIAHYQNLVEGKPFYGQASWKRPDGKPNFYEWTAVPLWIGSSVYIVGIDRDVTEQRLSQEAQQQTDQWLRRILQHSSDGINLMEYDVQRRTRRLVTCNDRFVELTGRSRDELMAADDMGIFSSPIGPPARGRQEDILSGRPYHGRSCWKRPDGRENYFEWSAASFRLADRVFIVGIDRDVTEQVRAQNALQESENRYRTMVESQLECVCRWLPDTRLTYVNEQYCRYFGRTREQLMGTRWLDLMPEEIRATTAEKYRQLVLDPKVIVTELEVVKADGSRRWQQWTDCPIFDPQGKLIEFQSVGHDFTESRRAEQELRRERDLANSLVQTAQAIVLLLDSHARVLLINPYGQKLMGYTQEEMLGKDWVKTAVGPETRDEVARIFRRTFTGRMKDHYVHDIRTKNGREITIRWHSSVLRDSEGAAVGLLCVGSDITEIRQKEEQLRQAQKMEAVGRLAGGIAHDFNNQLTVIKGYCDLLLRNGQAAATVREELEQIRHAAKRAASLTSQLLTFSRQQVLRPEFVNLNKILAGLASPLGTMIGEDIRLVTRFETELHDVLVDPVQVEQAVMNLAVNARDAMPKGGQLTIETANVMLDERHMARHVGAKVGPHVMLSVSDTGTGMDEETMKRIFDPFFTTKPVGQGTGLGLAMVYGFVDQSGGHITVQSQPGRGSTFRIYWPKTQGPSMADTAVFPALVPRGKETVLVVEDSEPVRQLIVRVLNDCGYQVHQAAGAGEAIPLIKKFSPKIDLLVTDVVMPEMSGPQLVSQMGQVAGMKVLYVTGYAEEALVPHGFKAQANLLTKPFTAERLAAAVRRVLDGQPA